MQKEKLHWSVGNGPKAAESWEQYGGLQLALIYAIGAWLLLSAVHAFYGDHERILWVSVTAGLILGVGQHAYILSRAGIDSATWVLARSGAHLANVAFAVAVMGSGLWVGTTTIDWVDRPVLGFFAGFGAWLLYTCLVMGAFFGIVVLAKFLWRRLRPTTRSDAPKP